MKTKVIFRKFRKFNNGAVIALFPELPGSSRYVCADYLHIGQHGSSSPHTVVLHTVPAKPEEYDDLATELRAIGYDLEVRQRLTPQMDAERAREWARSVDDF